ncbi:hypothetical protein PMAYCL1PPCAC_27060, partial [Pristionchus mayeri]
ISLQIDDVIYEDRDEWSIWRGRGDPVLHIDSQRALRQSDNVAGARVGPGKAASLRSFMWDSTLSFEHRATLGDVLRFKEIPPIKKDLMCGD